MEPLTQSSGSPESNPSVQFSVRLFATSWIAACQASLSIINSRSLLKLMPIESVMPSSHLILCLPLLLLPPIPPSIRVPAGLQNPTAWGLVFLRRFSGLGSSLWGLGPSLLGEDLYNYNYSPIYWSSTWGHVCWLYHHSDPPTQLIWFFLYLWSCRSFLVDFCLSHQ